MIGGYNIFVLCRHYAYVYMHIPSISVELVISPRFFFKKHLPRRIPVVAYVDQYM